MTDFLERYAALALAQSALSRAQRCHRLSYELRDDTQLSLSFSGERNRLASLSRQLYLAAGEDRVLVFE